MLLQPLALPARARAVYVLAGSRPVTTHSVSLAAKGMASEKPVAIFCVSPSSFCHELNSDWSVISTTMNLAGAAPATACGAVKRTRMLSPLTPSSVGGSGGLGGGPADICDATESAQVCFMDGTREPKLARVKSGVKTYAVQ